MRTKVALIAGLVLLLTGCAGVWVWAPTSTTTITADTDLSETQGASSGAGNKDQRQPRYPPGTEIRLVIHEPFLAGQQNKYYGYYLYVLFSGKADSLPQRRAVFDALLCDLKLGRAAASVVIENREIAAFSYPLTRPFPQILSMPDQPDLMDAVLDSYDYLWAQVALDGLDLHEKDVVLLGSTKRLEAIDFADQPADELLTLDLTNKPPQVVSELVYKLKNSAARMSVKRGYYTSPEGPSVDVSTLVAEVFRIVGELLITPAFAAESFSCDIRVRNS